MRVRNRADTTPNLVARAELEELVATRAAEVARFAEATDQRIHAEVFWDLARRRRIAAMMLRARGALAE